MLKGIIFDMDGVLVDNTAMHIRSFEIFFNRYGIDEAFRTEHFGRTNKAIFEQLMPEVVAAKGWKALSEEKEEIYRTEFGPILTPTAGLIEFLEACRREGIKCAIGSSACKENVSFVIDHLSIGKYMETWCCEDDVTLGKPDPEVYLKCSDRLGLAPEECIVFEDATAGITAGKRAGCKVVALTTSNDRTTLEATEADLVVDDFRDVTLDVLHALVD